jgi:hypothetical protein
MSEWMIEDVPVFDLRVVGLGRWNKKGDEFGTRPKLWVGKFVQGQIARDSARLFWRIREGGEDDQTQLIDSGKAGRMLLDKGLIGIEVGGF